MERTLPRLRCLLAAAVVAVAGCGPTVAAAPAATSQPQPSPAFRAPGILRITLGEWPPYVGEGLANGGPGAEIVRAAFAEEGISVEFGYFPWARSYELARAGTWDGTFPWQRTPERDATFYVSAPVGIGTEVLFHRADRPWQPWLTVADLSSLRFGVTAGYTYGATFDAAVRDGTISVETAASDAGNMDKLIAGRIDAFPIQAAVGCSLLRARSPSNVTAVVFDPQVINTAAWYVLLSRADPANAGRIDEFNAGLQALDRKGEIDRIWQRAGLDAPPVGATRC